MMEERTRVGATATDMGLIPHKPHPSGLLDMPVMLDVQAGDGIEKPQRPRTGGDGLLVYALPGGGTFTHNGKVR